jgi:hypothetical protein
MEKCDTRHVLCILEIPLLQPSAYSELGFPLVSYDAFFLFMTICLSICPPTRPSVALRLFVGPWPLFQFLNPIHSR